MGSVTFVPRTYKVQVLNFSVLASTLQSGRDNGFLIVLLVSPWVSPRVAPRVSHYTLGCTQGYTQGVRKTSVSPRVAPRVKPWVECELHITQGNTPGKSSTLGFTQGRSMHRETFRPE